MDHSVNNTMLTWVDLLLQHHQQPCSIPSAGGWTCSCSTTSSPARSHLQVGGTAPAAPPAALLDPICRWVDLLLQHHQQPCSIPSAGGWTCSCSTTSSPARSHLQVGGPAPAAPPAAMFHTICWWVDLLLHHQQPCSIPSAAPPAAMFHTICWWVDLLLQHHQQPCSIPSAGGWTCSCSTTSSPARSHLQVGGTAPAAPPAALLDPICRWVDLLLQHHQQPCSIPSAGGWTCSCSTTSSPARSHLQVGGPAPAAPPAAMFHTICCTTSSHVPYHLLVGGPAPAPPAAMFHTICWWVDLLLHH
eukprot:jgi/Pico_ML_1/56095/g1686.t2